MPILFDITIKNVFCYEKIGGRKEMNLKRVSKIILMVASFVMINTISANAAVYDITFNSEYYANKYADLKAAMGYNEAALKSHFYNYGIKEGRATSAQFDVKYYLANNADLKKAFGNNYEAAYNHFVNYGIKEGRASSVQFEAKHYLAKYADVKAVLGENYEAVYNHFVNYGIKEGRVAGNTAHIYGKATVIKEGTCTKPGEAIAKCTVKGCNATKKTQVKAEHKWCSEDDATVTRNATCSQAGERTYYCTVKGCAETKTEEIAKTEHNFDISNGAEVLGTTAPTCVKDGKKLIKCTNCTETKSESIEATGHDIESIPVGTGEVVKKATCSEKGLEKVKCKTCNTDIEREVPVKDHTLSTKTTVEPTCITKGKKVTACTECKHIEKEEVIPETGHPKSQNGDYDANFVKTLASTPGTCNPTTQVETKGERKLYCSKCNKTWSEELDGHQWTTTSTDTALELKEATCTQDGKKLCVNCGKTEVIPALGHDLAYADDSARPTCADEGTKICQRANCGYTESVDALGHNWKVNKEASCAKNGTLTDGERECIVCKVKESIKAAHEMETTVEDTCTAVGKEVCKKCGFEKTVNDIADHDWKYILIKPSTSSAVGSEKRVCMHCDKVEIVTIPIGQKGHSEK